MLVAAVVASVLASGPAAAATPVDRHVVPSAQSLLAPLSRFDLTGGIYNTVQTVRGGEGMFTGSVNYAVEVNDAASDRLLSAPLNRQQISSGR